ncbi:MAG: hypothetical protein RLZZ142_2712 [Verrucomicrobiota bacterium]|jgi:PAS domain S-box-containing protein
MSPLAAYPNRLLLLSNNPKERHLLDSLSACAPSESATHCAAAPTLEEGLNLLREDRFELVAFDLLLSGSPTMDTLLAIQHACPEAPLIAIADPEHELLARQAVQLGAQDYLLRSELQPALVRRTLTNAIERFRYQATLAQEREFLSTLLEHTPDRIYFKDHQSRFLRINRALANLLGLRRPEDAVGRSDFDFFEKDHAQNALDDEREVMRSGCPIINKVEFDALHGGGSTWSLTTKLPLRDRHGKVIGTCGISREINELKEMESTLESERNLLRAVIDHLPEHIFLKDTQGRYVLDNIAHQHWLGATHPSEVLGKTPSDFFPPEIARRFEDADRAIFRSGKPLLNFEERVVNSKGESHWALVTKVPWRAEDGRMLGLVCLKRDITPIKRTEEQLQQANTDLAASREEALQAVSALQRAHTQLREVQMQLIEAEKMKLIGRLAAGIAHEVKNPLAIIRMGLDFLHENTPPSDPTTHSVLSEMREAVQRADGVILGLLDFSKPNQLHTLPCNLNQLVEKALGLVRVEIKGAVEILKSLDPDLPPLPLDPEKINQVLVNLLTNALHAMDAGGTLHVRTSTKQLTGVGPNIAGQNSESFRIGQKLAVLEVEDSGHGIPEDKLGKIFEPFFTTKPTGRGTGLGLSVVKTIVDLHGGTIALANRPGGGACATVVFPL